MAATVTGDLLARARSGHKRSVARLVSVIENDEPGAAEAMRALYPLTGRAQVVGITGPPGGGKSTLVNRLAGLYRDRVARVAIVAVEIEEYESFIRAASPLELGLVRSVSCVRPELQGCNFINRFSPPRRGALPVRPVCRG